MSIAENIAARRGAEEMIAFIGEQSQRYWECLIELAKGKLPPKPEPVDPCPAMSDFEAARFENTLVPYGKFDGKFVGDVDPSYLLFLTEGDEWSKKLRRYVKSDRFQRRQSE